MPAAIADQVVDFLHRYASDKTLKTLIEAEMYAAVGPNIIDGLSDQDNFSAQAEVAIHALSDRQDRALLVKMLFTGPTYFAEISKDKYVAIINACRILVPQIQRFPERYFKVAIVRFIGEADSNEIQ